MPLKFNDIKSNYILDKFSFADIAIAVSLAIIEPVKHPKIPLKEKITKFTNKTHFAKKFPELLEWQQYIYQKYR